MKVKPATASAEASLLVSEVTITSTIAANRSQDAVTKHADNENLLPRE